MIPEVLERYPQARPVFDKYGLKGCGGPLGPYESIGYFARAHEVNEEKLLEEINDTVLNRPVELPVTAAEPDFTDTIYRRFFLVAIGIILTLGATWGAYLLWKIGVTGKFAGASIHEVNAHGQAQVFGWMGLFIMGFAYQAFPRFWNTALWRPRLALAVFFLMIAGVVSSSMAIAAGPAVPYAAAVAVAGSVVELLAVLIFTTQIAGTWKASGRALEPYVGYVFTALTWFCVSSAFNAWHVWNTMTAATDAQLQWYVRTFQWPLRDMQFHGLGMSIIFGVSLRTLPHLFGLPKVGERRAWSVLGLVTLAVILEVAFYLQYRLTGNEVFARALLLPWALLLMAAAIFVLPFRLWRPFPEADRSAKFIRTAFAWLFVSLVMLAAMPAQQALSHIAFSHAYAGAIRHAITVGFISVMIMGYSLKVVATLNGLDSRKLSAMWGPFVLINAGCAMRVGAEVLSDWYRGVFSVMGCSGVLEVAGLAWWSSHILGMIVRGKREEMRLAGPGAGQAVQTISESMTGGPAASEAPAVITGELKVASVLDWCPETETVFLKYGFQKITNKLLRNTVARQVSIAQACGMHGVPLEEFLLSLNETVLATKSASPSPPPPCGCHETGEPMDKRCRSQEDSAGSGSRG